MYVFMQNKQKLSLPVIIIKYSLLSRALICDRKMYQILKLFHTETETISYGAAHLDILQFSGTKVLFLFIYKLFFIQTYDGSHQWTII